MVSEEYKLRFSVISSIFMLGLAFSLVLQNYSFAEPNFGAAGDCGCNSNTGST